MKQVKIPRRVLVVVQSSKRCCSSLSRSCSRESSSGSDDSGSDDSISDGDSSMRESGWTSVRSATDNASTDSLSRVDSWEHTESIYAAVMTAVEEEKSNKADDAALARSQGTPPIVVHHS